MENRFIAVNEFPNASHLVGYVVCSFAELVRVFGHPMNETGDEYKVSTEWTIRDTVRNKLFTIYDYKETNLYYSGLPSVEQFRALDAYEWHIGCIDRIDNKAFAAFMSDALERDVQVYNA